MQADTLSEATPWPAMNGFSCPQETFDHDFLNTLAATYHCELWRLFCERFADPLRQGCSRLIRGLSGALPTVSHDDIWSRPFSHLQSALVGPEVNAPNVAIEIGLRLLARGHEMEWQAEMTEPTRLRFDRYLLPTCRTLEARSQANHVEVSLDGGQPIEFRSGAPGGPAWVHKDGCNGDLDRFPVLTLGGRTILLFAGDVSFSGGKVEGAMGQDQMVIAEIAEQLEGAIQLLSTHCGEYVAWVLDVLRGIAPLPRHARRLASWSRRDWYGLISMTVDARPPALAEILVHECTHQYYFQSGWFEPVDDGSDGRSYYSPVVKTERPINKILLAYHAFANVLIMNRCFLDAGVRDPYCIQNQSVVTKQLAQLDKALQKTSALTDTGRALYEPLARQVAETV